MTADEIAAIIAKASGVSVEYAGSQIYSPLAFAGRDEYWKSKVVENTNNEAGVIAIVTHDGEPLNNYFYSTYGTPEEARKQGLMWTAFREAGLWFEPYGTWYSAIREKANDGN